jgi:DDE family transposase
MHILIYAYYVRRQKKRPNPITPRPQPPFSPAQLLSFLVRLLPHRALRKLPALQGRRFYDRLFTPLVVLWYLLFQRLNPDHSLDAALCDARAGGADRINKRLSRKLRSDSTSAYSDARQRLPWQFLAQALSLQGRQIIGLTPTTLWHGQVLALLDGSTVRLRPHGRLARDFPPNGNQHRRPYWCLMRVVVCFCALSGAALDCASGSLHGSEQVLACRIILDSLLKSLFIGDRNFGVFRLAQAARHAGQAVLLRMTERRAGRLLGRAPVAGDHAVRWEPTRHDQLEPGCSPQPLEGRLLVVQLQRKGFRSQWLCLFTTLPNTADYSLPELVRLYGRRWHIELNLRYLKAQMDLMQLEAKSADMARKEWLAGLLAYNLVRAAQLCAALQKGVSPLTLSFSCVRRRLEDWLIEFGRTQRQARAQWAQVLEQMGRCNLPHRRHPRPNEPRAQRHLRLPYLPLYGSRAYARRHLKKYVSKS